MAETYTSGEKAIKSPLMDFLIEDALLPVGGV